MNENIINKPTPEINAQNFQAYFEDGIAKARTFKEFRAFLTEARKLGYEVKLTPNMLLIGAEATIRVMPEAITQMFIPRLIEALEKRGLLKEKE